MLETGVKQFLLICTIYIPYANLKQNYFRRYRFIWSIPFISIDDFNFIRENRFVEKDVHRNANTEDSPS